MVGNNKKLVSRVLNANGTVNWRHDNTYDRIYDNKGNELSQRKFFQGHTETNPKINWLSSYDTIYDESGQNPTKQIYYAKEQTEQERKIDWFKSWTASVETVPAENKKIFSQRFYKPESTEQNLIIDWSESWDKTFYGDDSKASRRCYKAESTEQNLIIDWDNRDCAVAFF
ncbi:hypothetical protein [Chrysanthemum yellows phytoplasma]|uniref:hypothetical protein n=1 Tax=Chrysanthemum yellows phytoplasma TaxID=238674 RepID=UPI00054CC295|nr:hypothetical protein [Chrysanthemum yellows phytoplasma]